MSHLVRKPTICIGENKGADQLRGNREADQRLCFRYSDSTVPLLLKFEISSFQPASVTVQPDLCRTCLETTLLVFLRGGTYISFPRKLVCIYFPRLVQYDETELERWTGMFYQVRGIKDIMRKKK